MTLAEIRKEFVRASNRYDLVVNGDLTANVDNGANTFINWGQRYLDITIQHPKQWRRYAKKLTIGDYQLPITGILSIKSVVIIDPNDARADITECFYERAEFRKNVPELVAGWDSGIPTFWTLNYIDPHPSLQAGMGTADDQADVDVTPATMFGYDGVMFYPKADAAYTLEVSARTLSLAMTADTDTSYWSIWYADLLVLAACYCFERFMKNDAGMRTWLNAMNLQAHAIDCNMVDLEFAGNVVKMEIE